MFDFFKSFFRPEKPSSTTAKERLRLVLLSDHISLSPQIIESMKADLLAVISRYVEIDSDSADVTFEHRENELAMLASVPIKGLRDGHPEPPERGGRGRREPGLAEDAPAAEPAGVEASARGALAVEVASAPPERHEPSEPEAPPEPQTAATAEAEQQPAQAASFANAETGTGYAPAATGKTARRRRRRQAARAALLQRLGGQALGSPAQA
jgi:cell division topological specificity factor